MNHILIKNRTTSFNTEIQLVSSKSESNRALIMNALMGFEAELSNLSLARDTQTMMRLLKDVDNNTADVLDAGTTMRFLTAYFSVTGQHKIMTGTPRMCERPIGILVDALRTLGTSIEYKGKDGYPPMALNGFQYSGVNRLKIRGDVSSQYISAIAMIAPLLPEGLVIELTGEVGSIPYIEMTLQQMRYFGVEVLANWQTNQIQIAPKPYQPKPYQIESDWSGASYWFSMVALGATGTTVELLGLKEDSLQGDSVVVDIMKHLGVASEFTGRGFRLTKIQHDTAFEWDFSNCPDLAQTIAVICVAKGIPAIFTGIESLKIKETDRVAALQNELAKFGGSLVEVSSARYEVRSSNNLPTEVTIETYDDHRMAMAFAPLALLMDVTIEEPDVVKKSYPTYWEHLETIFDIV
jgi:3-phosphoshikimate 1-carboxyvinyltransferase